MATEDVLADPEEQPKKPGKPAPTRPDDDGTSPESYVVKKARVWPLFVALALIAGGVAFGIFWFTSKPSPLKVLVMIEYEGGYAWEGSKPAASLSDRVCELLKGIGFEPVKIGDPKIDKVLAKAKSPEEAAKALDASFIVAGSLKPTFVEEKLPPRAATGAYVEARIDASLTIRHVKDPEAQAASAPIQAWTGALEKDAALERLENGVVHQIFEAAASRLMTHPTIVEILKGSDVAAMGQIGDARQYMELRKARIDVANRAYDEVLSTLRATPAGTGRKITFHTPADEEDSLVATGPEGFLVRIETAGRTIAPGAAKLEFLEKLEVLGWRTPATATAEPAQLWRGYHVYGRPDVGRDGTIVMIEDMFKFAKAITKKTSDGWKRMRVDPVNQYSGLRVSPKGDALAVWNTCPGCGGHMTLVNLADGLSLMERPEDEVSYGWTWLDDKRLAFIVKPARTPLLELDPMRPPTLPGEAAAAPEGGIELRTFNLKTHEEITLGRFRDSDGFSAPVASPDGRLIAVQHATMERGSNVLALIDTRTGELTDVTEARSGAWPAFSPDGSLVVYTEHDDLRLLRVKDRKVEPITENPLLEQNPMFSPDGKLIYFEVLDRDPVDQRRHVQIIASVEVAP